MPRSIYRLNAACVPEPVPVPDGIFVCAPDRCLNIWQPHDQGVEIQMIFTPVVDPESGGCCFLIETMSPVGPRKEYFRSCEQAEARGEELHKHFNTRAWKLRYWLIRFLYRRMCRRYRLPAKS